MNDEERDDTYALREDEIIGAVQDYIKANRPDMKTSQMERMVCAWLYSGRRTLSTIGKELGEKFIRGVSL